MNREKELLHDVKYSGMLKVLVTFVFVMGLALIMIKITVSSSADSFNNVAKDIKELDSRINISINTMYYLCCGIVMCIMVFVYFKTYIGRGKKLNRELEKLGLLYSDVNRDYMNGKKFGQMSTIYNIGPQYTIIAYRNNVRVINNYKIMSARREKRVVQKVHGVDVKRPFLILEMKEGIIEVGLEEHAIRAVIAEYKNAGIVE